MRTPVTALALCAVLAACGSTATTATPTPTPDRSTLRPATPAPTPAPQTGDMPAEWEEHTCLALNQLGDAQQDIMAMGEAAAGDDIDRVGLMAYAASGYALTAQVALMQAPAWEPGAAAVDALTALSETLVSGLELIDAATLEDDPAKLQQGLAMVSDAAAALVDVTPELGRLRDEYGLGCALP